MAESNVPISAGSGTNIRTITVQVDNSAVVAGGQPEQQQVLTLADEYGHLIKPFRNGELPVASEELALLLKAMLIRLDLLCHAIDTGYTPPDELGL